MLSRVIEHGLKQIQCHYDPESISQSEFLSSLITAQKSLPFTMNMEFSGRRITLPIVLNDPWNKEALERYMVTMRRVAVYLPSNIEYLGKNNGLEPLEALHRLVQTDWVWSPALSTIHPYEYTACPRHWLLPGLPIPCSSEFPACQFFCSVIICIDRPTMPAHCTKDESITNIHSKGTAAGLQFLNVLVIFCHRER